MFIRTKQQYSWNSKKKKHFCYIANKNKNIKYPLMKFFTVKYTETRSKEKSNRITTRNMIETV